MKWTDPPILSNNNNITAKSKSKPLDSEAEAIAAAIGTIRFIASLLR
jgi:hypothetical protein